MKKIVFLFLFVFMLAGCYSVNEPCGSAAWHFVIKLANSSEVIIDESHIEEYVIAKREGEYAISDWICLNYAGLEKLRPYVKWDKDFDPPIVSLYEKEFSIYFEGKKLYNGIFTTTASSKLYSCYTIAFIDIEPLPYFLVLQPPALGNSNFADRESEEKLFAYFESIGKLRIRE